ncbi:MAG: thioredoxin [Oscillospiraceae bacterium]|nr:thioredoxin [Oscillospiraceae bacterium]
MSVTELTKEAFSEKTAQGIAMVDFWADWCGPCKMLAPTMEELAEAYEGKVFAGKVNVDNEPELAAQFGVMSIPTVVFLRDGAEFERKVGVMPIENFQAVLDAALADA